MNKTIKRKKDNPPEAELIFGGTCPNCKHEVYTSSYNSVVTCPECDTIFAIQIQRETPSKKINLPTI